VQKQRSQSLQQLRERIVEHRHELAIEFESLDTTSIGTVIKNEWVAGMFFLRHFLKRQAFVNPFRHSDEQSVPIAAELGRVATIFG
jgi:hypothetical protein